MFINGRFVSLSALRSPNEWGESTGGGADTTPNSDNQGGEQGGKTETGEKTPESIPYGRFKEVNDENKAIKARLAELEKKEADALKAKQEADEADALKKWEHEKIISTKNAEIENHKAEKEKWEERTASIKTLVDVKLEEIKTNRGEEVLAKVKTAIGSDDPWVILEKLDSILALMGETTRPAGGQQQPAWGGESTYDVLKKKLDKWEVLTHKEEQVYLEALSKMDK